MDNFPLLFFCGCFGIIVLPASLLIIILVLKARNKAWTGIITNKYVNEVEDFDTNRKSFRYIIVVQLDGSRESKIEVGKEKYDEYQIGDRLKKESGKLWPERVS